MDLPVSEESHRSIGRLRLLPICAAVVTLGACNGGTDQSLIGDSGTQDGGSGDPPVIILIPRVLALTASA